MKKITTILIFSFYYLINSINSFAQFNINFPYINFNRPTNRINSFFKSIDSIKTLEFTFDSIRPLDEIFKGVGESSPWLSEDGNRLYYSQDQNHIYIAEKKSGENKFSNPHPLANINSQDSLINTYSPWLTNDELNIYFVQFIHKKSFRICHAKRDSLNHDFSNPVQIELIGAPGDIIYSIGCPSLTRDSNQLFIYYYTNIDEPVEFSGIFIFNKTGINKYTFSDSLLTYYYIANSGNLTNDDLSYYVSLFNVCRLFVLKRDSLNGKFSRLYYIKNSLINNDTGYSGAVTPYYSNSNRILAFSKLNNIGPMSWKIYFAYNFRETNIKENYSNQYDLNLCPNPVNQILNINFKVQEKGEIKIDIYDLVGNKIGTILDENKTPGKYDVTYDAGGIKSGIYIIKISDKNSIGFRKIIKI